MKSKLSRLDSASLSNGHGSVLGRAGGDLEEGGGLTSYCAALE